MSRSQVRIHDLTFHTSVNEGLYHAKQVVVFAPPAHSVIELMKSFSISSILIYSNKQRYRVNLLAAPLNVRANVYQVKPNGVTELEVRLVSLPQHNSILFTMVRLYSPIYTSLVSERWEVQVVLPFTTDNCLAKVKAKKGAAKFSPDNRRLLWKCVLEISLHPHCF